MMTVRKKILLITPFPFYPLTGGNRVRLHNLITAMRDMGHEITCIHLQQEDADQGYMQQLLESRIYTIPVVNSSRNVSCKNSFIDTVRNVLAVKRRYPKNIDTLYDRSVWDKIAEIGRTVNPDVVMAQYVFCSKALESFGSKTLKVIDTHDVFGDRHNIYRTLKLTPIWHSFRKHDEAAGLSRADIVIAIQKNDALYFSNLLPEKKIITVGHLTCLNRLPQKQSSFDMLYVGSRAFFNRYSVQWFLDKVFPKILGNYPQSRLILVGRICPYIKDRPGVIKLGVVPSYEEIYQKASIVINPVRGGTGLKIKNIEALGYAKALVTTSNGALGLEDGAYESFLVADKPGDFSDHVIRLFSDPSFREALSQKAYTFAENWNQTQINNLRLALDDA